MKTSPLLPLVLIILLPCFLLVDFSSARALLHVTPDECGPSHGNQSCPSDECCSIWGNCGTTYDYCAPGHCLPDYGMCWDSVPPPPPASPSLPPPLLPLTPDECGPSHGNQSCPSDECCSIWGNCGTTYDYCAPGHCLPDYGMCWDSVPPPPPASPSLPPPLLPLTPDECGPSHGNQSCPSDECCSIWGNCGTTYDYCAPGHCLPDYGMCWDSVPPPPPASPSLPPPLLPLTPDECGPSHGNQSCPSDECCSIWGNCGTTYDYCAPGHCLPDYGMCWDSVPPPPPASPSLPPPLLPLTPDECGPSHGNQSCPSDECCSIWGNCGTTSDYCAPGHCLPDYGMCWDNKADSLVREVFEKMEPLYNF